jgi:hypothetical protein
MRTGGRVDFDAACADTGIIASSHGNASPTPLPRNKLRREIDDLPVVNCSLLITEWRTENDVIHQALRLVIIPFNVQHDIVHDAGILQRQSSAKSIPQHLTRKISKEQRLPLEQRHFQLFRPCDCCSIG